MLVELACCSLQSSYGSIGLCRFACDTRVSFEVCKCACRLYKRYVAEFMRFTLPAQLKGPEAKVVMVQIIELRRRLEPVIDLLEQDHLNELSPVIRVGGSLGGFGEDGIDNIEIVDQILTCDIVVTNQDWENRSDDWIYEYLKVRVLNAISKCLIFSDVDHDMELLQNAVGDAT